MKTRSKTKKMMKGLAFVPGLALIFMCAAAFSQQLFIHPGGNQSIYHGTWIDLNKNGKMDVYEDPKAAVEDRVKDLLGQMTLEEKTVQLATLYGYHRVLQDDLPKPEWKQKLWKDGIGNIDEHLNGLAYNPQAATEYSWPPSKHARAINEVQRFFVEDTRLGIPVDFTNEGITGLCHHGATSFPVQPGQGSSWDRALVREIGRIEGAEARILGYTNIYSPILDLARDPRWGRAVECYGEEPYHAAELGKEMVRGLQENGVVSTAKHFAVYSVPKGGRDGKVRTDPNVTWQEVHEILLTPFREAVREANVMGLMSSYNDYGGVPVSASKYFLTDLLRKQWGFKGYIVSDSGAVEDVKLKHFITDDPKECVRQVAVAGMNIRTEFNAPENYVMPLRQLVAEGAMRVEVINERVAEVLRVKFWLGLFDRPYVTDPDAADRLIHNKEHEAVALRASRESLVLLKNKGLLPVDMSKLKTILVTGPNAKAINTVISRYGPSNINVVTVYDGISALAGDKVKVEYIKGCDHYDSHWPENELYSMPIGEKQKTMINKAVDKAKEADLVVVVVGDDEKTVGESKSRTSLNLPGNQEDLVRQLYKTGKPMVVVLLNGRPLTINWIDKYVPAVIEAWFPGEYGGRAIAEAIFGLYNPGGKLPMTFPKTVGQIPYNFPAKKSSQLDQPPELPDYFTTQANGVLYPFGHGLSYTEFEYSDLKIEPAVADKTQDVKVSFMLKNTGAVRGDEVPQLYVDDMFSSVVGYEKRLKGFERVSLEPGESKRIEFVIKPEKQLSMFDADMKEVVEPGDFEIFVGSSSENNRLKGMLKIK